MAYKILTEHGWEEFEGIRKIPQRQVIEIVCKNGHTITCTKDHRIYIDKEQYVEASTLKIGDKICCKDGYDIIEKIVYNNDIKDVYDVMNVSNGNKFLANDILVHNCEFIGKTNSLIDPAILRQKIAELGNTTYKFTVDSDVRFYKELEPYKKYLISLDTSMGVSGDFAAMEIFEFPGFYQVAEWKSDALNQNDQIEKVKRLTEWMYSDIKNKGNLYPEIYWSMENNGSAEGFICALREIERQNGGRQYIKRATLITENGSKRMGFTTTKVTKSTACSQLKILFETNRFHILSHDYMVQLSNFSLGNLNSTSYSAKSGHDDCISASLTIILMYLQMKNTFDLDNEIVPINKSEDERYNPRYEDPFLYFTNRW